jgi:hypothetical protein
MGIDKVGGALFAFKASEVATPREPSALPIDTPVWIAASLSNFLSRSSSAHVSARAAFTSPVRRFAPIVQRLEFFVQRGFIPSKDMLLWDWHGACSSNCLTLPRITKGEAGVLSTSLAVFNDRAALYNGSCPWEGARRASNERVDEETRTEFLATV